MSLTATPVKVWRENCGRSHYELTVEQKWADWKAHIRVYKPNGRLYEKHDIRRGDSTTGDVLVCPGYDRPGVYRVTASVTGYDSDHNVVDTVDAHTRFRFTIREKDPTRLVLKIKHVRHGYWVFTGTLTRRGHHYAHQRVRVQMRYQGVWGNLKTKMTDRAGVAHFNARPEPGAGKYRLRLYFPGSDHARAAASRIFRLYP